MSDTIKCACPKCGAKYRLPIEAQGRSARCKQCTEKFEVPREQTVEDSVLAWLTESDDEEEASTQPRVITMPTAGDADPEVTKRVKGIIRMKTGAPTPEPH